MLNEIPGMFILFMHLKCSMCTLVCKPLYVQFICSYNLFARQNYHFSYLILGSSEAVASLRGYPLKALHQTLMSMATAFDRLNTLVFDCARIFCAEINSLL